MCLIVWMLRFLRSKEGGFLGLNKNRLQVWGLELSRTYRVPFGLGYLYVS